MYTNNEINTVNQLYSYQSATLKMRVGKRYIRVILDSGVSINIVNTDFIKSIILDFMNKLILYKDKEVRAATKHHLIVLG
jgi:hypothetical protein